VEEDLAHTQARQDNRPSWYYRKARTGKKTKRTKEKQTQTKKRQPQPLLAAGP
jgi:hypothetical protein